MYAWLLPWEHLSVILLMDSKTNGSTDEISCFHTAIAKYENGTDKQLWILLNNPNIEYVWTDIWMRIPTFAMTVCF